MIGRIRRAMLLACLAIAAPRAAQPAEPGYLLDDFQRGSAIVEASATHCVFLGIYFADTAAQRAQGLMHVRQLGSHEGMLFRYPGIGRLTMWMKNTYVSLDMLFIREDGSVAEIATRTVPQSTARISSIEAVAAVLEVNAGFAARWSIEPGSRLLAIHAGPG